ncbi:MAG: hypothetical protein LKE40_12665 [Spirochaetia bacterium]|nr:hypothetical protein [Spirochaetia bacterium]
MENLLDIHSLLQDAILILACWSCFLVLLCGIGIEGGLFFSKVSVLPVP